MAQDPWMVVGDLAWAAIVGITVAARYYGFAAFLTLALLLMRIYDAGRR
jgi:hypothetical protein